MRGIILFVLGAAALGAASPASADAKSYCEAFARDAATARLSGNAIITGVRKPVAAASWQGAYDASLADCLATYARPSADQRPLHRIVRQKPAATAPAAALTPGSPEWNDYCAKKYTSFDAKTGLYTGQSGKKRRCLVTKP